MRYALHILCDGKIIKRTASMGIPVPYDNVIVGDSRYWVYSRTWDLNHSDKAEIQVVTIEVRK